ncbi:MAG: DUF4369 domain-containing protein [Flavobacterium sp.]
MKYLFLLTVLSLLFISCRTGVEQDVSERFHLNVLVKNIPDSTTVYLYKEDLFTIMDSTVVINERFVFSGNVEVPELCYLFFNDKENKRSENYKYLFVENKSIYVEGDFFDFFNATVSGSKQSDLLSDFQLISRNSSELEKKSDELIFLYLNANNQMAINEILYKKKKISKDSLSVFYNKLDEKNANSPKGQELLTYSKTISIKKGDKFREISGYNLEGKKIKLSDFYGKVVLLNFYSKYCGYCTEQHRKQFPALLKKYKQENFLILSYCIDTEEVGFADIESNNFPNWLNISDFKGVKGSNISKYDIVGIPDNFIIDKDGTVSKSFFGFTEGDNTLDDEINKLVKSK